MATGRPLRTEYDRTQNYKDYMKNLDLQIKNNKTNYDANILYKNTGVPTQPPTSVLIPPISLPKPTFILFIANACSVADCVIASVSSSL